jgi:hypothetical protein
MDDREDTEALAEELRPPGPDTEPGLTFRRVIAQRVLASDWLAAHDAALTAERDELREQVARVEALRVGWRDEGVGLGASALLSDCADDLDAVLHPTDGAS